MEHKQGRNNCKCEECVSSQRLMRYDFLMWSLGGRGAPRGYEEMGASVGLDRRAIHDVERRALQKVRRQKERLR